MTTIAILAGAFLVGSTLAYRAVHAWRAPMPAPRATYAYRPLSDVPTHVVIEHEVPHVDVDAMPNYSPMRAIEAAERGAPVIMSKREIEAAERAAVLALVVPFQINLDNALRRFSLATAEAMATARRWLTEADPHDELALWRANTPTAGYPVVKPRTAVGAR